MKENYTKIYTDTTILVKRLQNLLHNAHILTRIKSDKLPGYEITNYIDELFVLNKDVEKATMILEEFKAEINS